MPSIVHGCGAKLHFPKEMAGRKGRCPTCGDAVVIPLESEIRDTRPRTGLAPRPAAAPPAPKPVVPRVKSMHLDPPAHWDQYQAFLDGKGPNPRPLVVPANLLLKDEADAKWEAALKKGAPSKYQCPGCKDRLEVGAMVCTKCGLDLRTGRTLDGKTKVNEAGLDYLARIPWLQNPDKVETQDDADDDEEGGGKKRLVKRRPRR
jgi:hypothetical protein